MSTEVAIREYELPEAEKIRSGLTKIREYQNIVKELLVKDLDYGVIPGTQKPTLLKPGAEKLAKIHGLSDTYEILKEVEEWEKPFFEYVIKCTLTHIQTGIVISEGIGSCNSWESKYRYRNIYKKEDIPEGVSVKEKRTSKGIIYLIPNDDIYSQVNTLQKMAKKRALVDATLSACRLSAIFTQDIEDLPSEPVEHPTDKKESEKNKEPNSTSDVITEAQAKRFYAIAKSAGWEDGALKEWLVKHYGIDSTKKITKAQYENICNAVTNF